jgi:hypothetical protein
MVSVTDPYSRILGFLDMKPLLSLSSSFSILPTHEAEWTAFQTHYFSENLVAPRTFGSVARNPDRQTTETVKSQLTV